MGNIRSAWKYTTPDGKVYNGDELINNFNGAHNAITEAGRREIERDFGITPDKPQVSVQRFAEIMQRKALSSMLLMVWMLKMVKLLHQFLVYLITLG